MLGYHEFKALGEVIGRQISEDDFRQILSTFISWETADIKESGLLLDGLKQYFVTVIEDKAMQEDQMFLWLENLGYD